MNMFCLCVYLCICLCLLVVYAKPPHSDQFLGRSEDSEATLQCFEIKTSLYSKIYFEVKHSLISDKVTRSLYGAVAESQEQT